MYIIRFFIVLIALYAMSTMLGIFNKELTIYDLTLKIVLLIVPFLIFLILRFMYKVENLKNQNNVILFGFAFSVIVIFIDYMLFDFQAVPVFVYPIILILCSYLAYMSIYYKIDRNILKLNKA